MRICGFFCLALLWTAMSLGPPATAAAPGQDVMVVLDNSGSMRTHDPDFLIQQAVMDFLGGLGPNARMGIVIFDRQATLAEPLAEVGRPLARANLLERFKQVNYTGEFSNIPAAVERALYELKTRSAEDARKVIVLLTDGIVDTGNPAEDAKRESWLIEDLTQDCRRAAVHIYGIAFTEKADFRLIQTMAVRTGGEYFRAFSSREIHKVFQNINRKLAELQPSATPVEADEPEAPPPVAAAPAVGSATPLSKAILLAALVLAAGALGYVMWVRRKKALAPEGMPRAELIDLKNVTGRQTFRLQRPTLKIGRDASNDIVIPQDTVSGLHAVIEFRNGFFHLSDHYSKNKTRLNDVEIPPHTPHRLKNGDSITINKYRFIFLLPQDHSIGETMVEFSSRPPVERGARHPAPPPQAILIDVENVTREKTITLDKTTFRIGRDNANELTIARKSISGAHAAITCNQGIYYLEDQRSTNKTFLNGEALTPYTPSKLKSGDEIGFDIFKFIFLLEGQTPSGDTGQRWAEEV